MSVSGELLCSFELLKPLDSSALKNHIKKGRNKRNSILNSPVSFFLVTWSRLGADVVRSLQLYPLKAFNEERCVSGWTKRYLGLGVLCHRFREGFLHALASGVIIKQLVFPNHPFVNGAKLACYSCVFFFSFEMEHIVQKRRVPARLTLHTTLASSRLLCHSPFSSLQSVVFVLEDFIQD